MTDLRKAAEMALEVLSHSLGHSNEAQEQIDKTKQALRQALAQTDKPPVKSYCGGKPNYCTPEQEPVTLLPDGSAFGVMSFPLPESHWLYAEREYRDGEHEPIELGKPILTHELRGVVVSAMRYAIRGATNLGKEMDFDPDALVQNAVYALCGPYTPHVDAVNMSQERVDETAKRKHECPDWDFLEINEDSPEFESCLCYTAPPKREWFGLNHFEGLSGLVTEEFYAGAVWAEKKLKEMNGG